MELTYEELDLSWKLNSYYIKFSNYSKLSKERPYIKKFQLLKEKAMWEYIFATEELFYTIMENKELKNKLLMPDPRDVLFFECSNLEVTFPNDTLYGVTLTSVYNRAQSFIEFFPPFPMVIHGRKINKLYRMNLPNFIRNASYLLKIHKHHIEIKCHSVSSLRDFMADFSSMSFFDIPQSAYAEEIVNKDMLKVLLEQMIR